MMPEMDGMEVLTRLKDNKRTRNLPVFMLTARGTIADLDEAFKIGADDYITKPSDLTLLGKTVYDKWEKFTN
jgi:two-component system alkaline phosphatase synthesis response regulator PhoP